MMKGPVGKPGLEERRTRPAAASDEGRGCELPRESHGIGAAGAAKSPALEISGASEGGSAPEIFCTSASKGLCAWARWGIAWHVWWCRASERVGAIRPREIGVRQRRCIRVTGPNILYNKATANSTSSLSYNDGTDQTPSTLHFLF